MNERGVPLHTKILIGLVLGAIAGGTLNAVVGGDNVSLKAVVDHVTEPIGQLFLRLLLLLVVPLVFSSLTLGVAGIGDIRRLGRIGVKSMLYTLVISAISVVIGLTLANTIKPGKRISPEIGRQLSERYSADAAKKVESATSGASSTDKPLMKAVKHSKQITKPLQTFPKKE